MSKLSSNKGANFERLVAKTLSMALSNNRDAFAVSRRSASGGAMRDKKGLSSQGGDLQADKKIAEWFFDMYCVELKHYADLKNDLWSFMEGEGRGKFLDFIEQAWDASEVLNKHFLLIIKTDRKMPLVITNYLFCRWLNCWMYGIGKHLKWMGTKGMMDDIYLLSFTDFISALCKYLKEKDK